MCFTNFNIVFFAVQMQESERRFQETHEKLLQTQVELKAAQLEAIDSIRQINELQGNTPVCQTALSLSLTSKCDASKLVLIHNTNKFKCMSLTNALHIQHKHQVIQQLNTL